MFSAKDTINTSTGIQTMDRTPKSFEGRTLRILNVNRKYHSGSISISVEKGLEGSNIEYRSAQDKPMGTISAPNITIGNTNRISLGQAGSPYKLCPRPLDKLKQIETFFK